VPERLILLTNGISPGPAKDSVFETGLFRAPALLNFRSQGPIRLVGLLFELGKQFVVQRPSNPLKKFGVTALVIGLIPRVIVNPVERLVVLATPIVPLKPLGTTSVAPYRIKPPLANERSFGPTLNHCRKGSETLSCWA
jgi:hypothetical protein